MEMKGASGCRFGFLALALLLWSLNPEPGTVAADLPQTLAGWKLELLAEAPRINHPSVVCSAPDGRIFVAEDPMDIRQDVAAHEARGRILCVLPDGQITVFAEKLHAVFGMQYLEGKLYVLHNPKFSVFTDIQNVGREPVDLIAQTNPKPWALDWNDHVPANFRLGLDGFFYVAIGDKGLFGTTGRDGSKVELQGGGILRLRPDGTELEIFSRGVRNILDVAMNAEDEMFTYDNTDEHNWMGRLTHMVEKGSYGYPHDFIPRRPYTLWMMHDFGGGAATGVECYTEDALPPEYRGNLFLADFGKRQVLRVQTEREGASWRVVKHQELFPDPPEDFRPVGIAWAADGASLLLCDWQHRDTKENAQAGRLWKATFTNAVSAMPKPSWYVPAASGRAFTASDAELLEGLKHSSRRVRLTAQRRLSERKTKTVAAALTATLTNVGASSHERHHALWALDGMDAGLGARQEIMPLAKADPDHSTRRQVIRQLGLRRVKEAGALLSTVVPDSAMEPSIRFHAATALGRVGSPATIPALLHALNQSDLFARYAAFTALNQIGRAHPEAWKTIARELDNTNARVREAVSFALRDTEEIEVVTVLAEIVASSTNVAARESALGLLAPLHHRLPPWNGDWWAYHPALAPPPKRTVEWAGTKPVLAALHRAVADPAPTVRLLAVEGIQAAEHLPAVPALIDLYRVETNSSVRRAVLQTFAALRATNATSLVRGLLMDPPSDGDLMREAIRAASALGGKDIISGLDQLARSRHGTRGDAVSALGELRAAETIPTLTRALADPEPSVRLAAIRSLGDIKGPEAFEALRSVADSKSILERRALASALGGWSHPGATALLLGLWRSPETRSDALTALARRGEVLALDAYLEGLASANSAVREQCRKAVKAIRDEALSAIESRVGSLSPVVIAELRDVYREHESARKGAIFAARTQLPTVEDYARFALTNAGDARRGQRVFWDDAGVACLKCHQVAGHGVQVGPDLTLIGTQFPRRELIEHILEPSKSVREGYQQFTVETHDGESFSGSIKSESTDALTMIDSAGQLQAIPRRSIASRRASALSLMPEGLQVGLTLEAFADLIAFLESRKLDPRVPSTASVPPGFETLFNGRDLAGWREMASGTKRVDARAVQKGTAPTHWIARDGVLEHEGRGGDLWTERDFGNFDLRLEWRWPDAPKWERFPLINADGLEAGPDGKAATERVLDAGDSGVLLRGLYKAQANIFCYPVGSGEFWEYRTDPNSTAEERRAFTPSQNADRPIGDWNEMRIQMRGERVSVEVNGQKVIREAKLPGIPVRGPIGLQHEHGRIQFRHLFVQEFLKPADAKQIIPTP